MGCTNINWRLCIDTIDTGGLKQENAWDAAISDTWDEGKKHTRRSIGRSCRRSFFRFISDSFSPASAFAWKYTCLAYNIQHPPGEAKKKENQRSKSPRVFGFCQHGDGGGINKKSCTIVGVVGGGWWWLVVVEKEHINVHTHPVQSSSGLTALSLHFSQKFNR